MGNITRRDLLKILSNSLLALSGLLGLRGLFRFLSYQTEEEPSTEFDLGKASDYPIGSRLVRPDIPAVVLHTEKGFTALSLVCTHLGCTVDENASGFSCPCHSSRFDENGHVMRGPADKALSHLSVEQTRDGGLVLHVEES